MTIVEIVPSLNVGGLQKFTIDLSNSLTDYGHIIHFIVLDKKRANDISKEISSNINIHYIEKKKKRLDLNLLVVVFKLIKKIKPNIIHTHGIGLFYLSLVVLLNDYKVVHTIHNLAQNESGFIRRSINNVFFKFFNVIPVSISDEVTYSVKSKYSFKNIIQINNGISIRNITSNFKKVGYFISQIKKNSDTKVLINVGRIDAQKNQKLLVDSFNLLKRKGYDIVLLIIGDSGKESNPLFLELLSISDNKDIYYLDVVDNIIDYLYHCDLFCLSSKFEGLPISLLEALSVGLLPACTPAGGVKSVLGDDFGYVSKDFTKESYTDTIEQAILNNKQIKKIELIREFNLNYSIKKCASSYHRLFERLNSFKILY